MARNSLRRERKFLAKSILARVPRSWKGARGRVVVLCYHSIHPTHGFASATPARFDEQVRWLKDHCQIIPLNEALDRVRYPSSEPPLPAVAITFDDGYEDNFFNALPILIHHGVAASFFVTTGFIDREPSVMDHMRRLRRMEVSSLSWSQVQDMHEAGMQIGSHTVTHRTLKELDDRAVQTELTDSRRVIEDHLGEEVRSLAYPFGVPLRHFNVRTIDLAGEAGYRIAVSMQYRNVRRWDQALNIPRIVMKNNSLLALKAKIAGSLDIIARWQGDVSRRALGSAHYDGSR
jgi:peptidoglycan/xylan/chitin deacetylase (PgdA/CDA1 family)